MANEQSADLEKLKKEVWYIKQKIVPDLEDEISDIAGGSLSDLSSRMTSAEGNISSLQTSVSGKTSVTVNGSNQTSWSADTKVDKVSGKGLSSNDFTSEEKTKLAGLSNYDDSNILSEINDIKGKIVKDIDTQYVRITDLTTGIYRLKYNGDKYIYYWGETGTSTHLVQSSKGDILIFVDKYVTTTDEYWHWYYIVGQNSYPSITFGFTDDTLGQYQTKNFQQLLTTISSYVKNELTYSLSNTTYALSAYQGYILKGLVDDLTNNKQDKLTFDSTPTSASDNPVKSGGVYSALSGKQNSLSQVQLDAANSGITSTLVGKISANEGNISSLQSGKQDSLSQTQLDAVNSGITSRLVTKIGTNESNISSLQTNKQDKLTAGTNITIDANNVISASGGGSGSVTVDSELSSTSTNPVENRVIKQALDGISNSTIKELDSQYVRITDLATGVYKLTYNGTKYIYYSGSNSTSTHAVSDGSSDNSVILVVNKGTSSSAWPSSSNTYWHWYYINSGSGSHPTIYYGYTTSSSGSQSSKAINSLLTSISSYVKDNLTYSTSGTTYALSAYQGYVLNNSISGLDGRVGTIETQLGNFGEVELIKSSSGGASNIGSTSVGSLSNYSHVLVTYKYNSTSGSLVTVLYPVGLLKTMTSSTPIGENGNYHSVVFNATYTSSSDTLSLSYSSNSRAYSVCIYAVK